MRIFKAEAKQMRNDHGNDDDATDESKDESTTERAEKPAQVEPKQVEPKASAEDPVKRQLQEARRSPARQPAASAKAETGSEPHA
jgi:hypothetical protein